MDGDLKRILTKTDVPTRVIAELENGPVSGMK